MRSERSRLNLLSGRDAFERRSSITAGVVATVLILMLSMAAATLLNRSLTSAIDDDLRQSAIRYQEVSHDNGASSPNSPTEGIDDAAAQGIGPFYIQKLGDDGRPTDGELPVSDQAIEVAQGSTAEMFEEIMLEDRLIRVLTISSPGQIGALQVGTDVTNTYASLKRIRLLSIPIAAIGGLAIALVVASLLGARLLSPIAEMADAVNRIGSDGELPDRLDGEGPDEFGRLVTSFNGMLDDVRRSRAQQRRLVADASHELRTPLTRLRIKIEFVYSQPQLPESERQRLIAGAVADLTQLGGLVAELLELAAEGTAAEQSQPLQLANVISSEVDRFRTVSGRTVDLSTTPGVVQIRPRQVTRALANLLVNADKYSPSGHPISVTQRGCRIEVRDQGPGIPVNERDRVFDRFYRGSGHHSIDGSGLGLAIVESVARVNGGTTWIRDPADGGAGTVVGFSIGPELPGREPTFRPQAVRPRH